ncbi:PGF-pre-PGF domain-containing protein [Methanohalophilus portucalensis]|nr:PGF-pre-PGF domain-containing protein [Methanohalophilus portucalensis]OJH48801.1 hypothetical protein MPF_1649 [Methanohalophilus portucalensis FDF-1]
MVSSFTGTANEIELDFESHLGGTWDTVEVSGDHAYAGQGQDFVILDISDTANPHEISRFTTSSLVNDVTISGNYAYIANGESGLVIMDISDPFSPSSTGSVYLGWRNFATDISVDGNYAYVCNEAHCSFDDDGMIIIDISDPTNPFAAGSYTDSGYLFDVTVDGNYAYATNYSDLVILDINDPKEPLFKGIYTTPGNSLSVDISGNYAYVADDDNGLLVLDVSNPESPSYAGEHTNYAFNNNNAEDIEVSGNYAYIADDHNGLVILDINNPSSPVLAGIYDADRAVNIDIFDNHVYIADHNKGLSIIDVSNPESPEFRGLYEASLSVQDVEISGNYAYIADEENGLAIVNLTDNTSPEILSIYDENNQFLDLTIVGNCAYLVDANNGFVILDISNPMSPQQIGNCETNGYARYVAVGDNYAYLMENDGSGILLLSIIDITSSYSPELQESLEIGPIGYDPQITISDNYAFISNGDDGFVAVDVSNPASPSIAGNCKTNGGAAEGIAVNGNYAYIADGYEGLAIMDISKPSDPEIVKTYYSFDITPTTDIAIEGDYAYVSSGYEELSILDISDSINPVLLDNYNNAGYADGITVAGNHAYVNDGDNGLVILSINTPSEPNKLPTSVITSISPNPANEGDTIVFQGLGEDSDGTITEYSWTSNLEDEVIIGTSPSFTTSDLSSGIHTISFSAKDDDGAWSESDSTTLKINEKPNVMPTSKIDSITPNPATEGNLVSFTGSGTDSDGNIVGYNWTSSIDGHLHASSSFSISDLSPGTHTISFSVQDDDGAWSNPVSETLEIVDDQAPEVNISATPIENVSIHNPVTIRLNSTDNHPAITEFVIQDSEGQNVTNLTVTDDVANGATWEYVWNATFSNGAEVPSGTYWLFVNSSDTSDNTASANVSVVVDNTEPTVSITEITGSNTVGEIVHANSILQVNATADGTPGNVSALSFTLDSEFTSFHRVVEASFVNGEWTAEFDLTTIPNDGKYTVTATVTDAALNTNFITASKTVLLDRKAPSLYPVSSVYNETHGIVNISASECLDDTPVVDVNADEVELSKIASKWSGFFNLGGSDFNINVTGIDVAGNVGVGNSTMHIERIETVNNTANFTSKQSGTTIDFRTNNDTKSNITVTESDKPLANVTNGSVGLHFIDVNFGKELQTNLTNATIRIPVNMSLLPEGVAVEDVTIRYYNETSDEWEPFSTSVETIDDVEYWVATVNHFSTYGAMADDKTPPILDDVTPEDGTKFDEDTTSVNIRFNYSDAASDINVSSIIFKFNGNEISASDDLEITGNYAAYNATGLDTGDYTAEVIVADAAGNNATFTTIFSIAPGEGTETKPGSSGGSSSSGGGGGGGNTGEAFENILTKAAQTCKIAPGETARYEFGEEKCNISYIQFTGVTNAGQISTLIEVLKDTSALVDEDAPGEVYQNLNIWVGNAAFGDDKVEDSVIGFRVDKEWLANNGFDASEVALFHYSDGIWNKLSTTQTDEDDGFIYFEAETPGFSPFAISAVSEDEESLAETTPTSEETIDEGVEEENVEQTPEMESDQTPGFSSLLSIFMLIVTLFIIQVKRT